MNMLQDSHPDYEWFQLYTKPAHVGFAATSRDRTYVIGCHTSRSVCLVDPFDMYDAIKASMEDYACTKVGDYLVASEQDLLLEMQDIGRVRNVPHQPGVMDFSHYLTSRELQSKDTLDAKYLKRTGTPASNDRHLVYYLGDSASYTTTWSAHSQALPTFRLGSASGKYWLPAYQRWLTPRERLVAMGFPVTAETAEAMKVPVVWATDTKRAASILGNCMHFTTAGIFQLVALSCFGPADFDSWGFC